MSNLKVSSVRFVLAAAFLSIIAGHLWGQGATATVLGTVTDSSGAAVPNASVQVKNTQTGVNQTVTSDAQGRYRAADVAVGAYEVQASKAGFSTVVHKGIVLSVGAQVIVDFALPVGQQQQTVTVEGQVQEVETTNAAIGSYTSQQQMADLPLNGRNFEQLIMLSPGVTPVAWGYAPLQGRAEQYSIAGARPEGQAIMLDDDNLQSFWNNGMGSVTGSSLGVEAIGEFQTLTNAYGAQFGGNGSVINAVSKSGTNDFHGSAFDYLRNSVLDARDFFSTGKFGNSYTPPFRRNQYGGSIGGPIKKDKLFFFADYEGIQQLKEENALATVPNCTGGIGPTAPICTVTATNPTAATAVIQTLRLYPAPQTLASPTATTGHAVTYGSQLNHENYGLFRIDYNINEKDSVFLRYFNDTADFTEPFGGGAITGGGAIPTWTEVDGSAANYAVLEERHLFSPTVVNVARFSFSRPTKESNEATIAAPDAPGGTLPIGSAPCGTAVTYCPQTPLQFWPQYFGQPVIDGLVQPSGLSSVGGAQSEVFNLVQNRYTEGDDLLWTHGAHSFHFGAYLDRSQANTWNPHKEDMIWTFSSLTNLLAASAPGVEGVNPSPTNNPYRDYRQIDFVPYAQDDWKISQKLTVNLGLRWEFATNPVVLDNTLYEVANIATSTNYSPFSHIFSANPSWTNFDPRVGIAYDPFADHKTAIRAGFGMFHDPVNPLDYQVGLQSAPPFEDQKTSAAQVYPFGFASGTPGLPTATSGWNRSNNSTPYMIQYNASVQRELLPNTVLTVAYVGSRGIHLFSGIEANPPIPTITNGVYTFGTLGATSISPNPRLNPNFGTFVDFEPISYSEYNALQVMLNHRFSQSLTAQVNYTWSQCLGDGENALGNLISTDGVPGSVENPFNQSIDKGPCSFDLPQVLRVNALYALPFKANRVVSGWQLSGIVTRLSGQPMNVSDGFDQVGLQAGDTPRPNYIAGCNPYAGGGTITEWFNTVSSAPGQSGCYSVQAPGTLGDVGRDTLRGPGFFDFDLAVLKDTKITERLRMQFRAEFFNIFNHENFAAPPSALFTAAIAGGVETIKTNPAAGVITSTNEGSTPRQIQFAVKFLF